MHLTRHAGWAVAGLALVTLFRLWYVDHLGLVGDEAYYWLWSRHPDVCYLDKGPLIAWFIFVGTKFFGQTVFGIRLFAVVLAAGTGVCLFRLAQRLFSDRVGLLTVTLAAITPLYAVGSVLMTIDTVYIFFWTAAALAFWRAKDQDRFGPWVWCGALLGLGALAKYTALFEGLSFGLFCAWHPASRRHLRNAKFAAMLLTAGACLAPALLWNAAHGWPTSRFLVHRGELDQRVALHPGGVLTFLGGQAGVISPLLWFGLLASASRPGRWWHGFDKRMEAGFLLCLFWPLFGFYFLLSFQHLSEANWPAAAYVGGLVLLAARGDLLIERGLPWQRGAAIAALVLAALETAALHDSAWLRLPHRADPLDRARGWPDLAAKVVSLQRSTGAQFVIANKYMTASLLSFYLPKQPAVYLPVSSPPYNQLVLWPGYREEHPGEDALLVSDIDRTSPSLGQDFAEIDRLGAIDTEEAGRKVNRFYVFVCRRGHADPPTAPKG